MRAGRYGSAPGSLACAPGSGTAWGSSGGGTHVGGQQGWWHPPPPPRPRFPLPNRSPLLRPPLLGRWRGRQRGNGASGVEMPQQSGWGSPPPARGGYVRAPPDPAPMHLSALGGLNRAPCCPLPCSLPGATDKGNPPFACVPLPRPPLHTAAPTGTIKRYPRQGRPLAIPFPRCCTCGYRPARDWRVRRGRAKKGGPIFSHSCQDACQGRNDSSLGHF